MRPDYRLQFTRINARDLPYHFDLHVLSVILRNREIGWRMVLLIRHQNVTHEGTLRGQKRNRQLHGFPVPILTVLPLVADTFDHIVLLVQEPELSAQTKIAHAEEADLLKNVLSGQLHCDARSGEEVLKCKRRHLHNIADVQTVDPFVLIQVTQDIFHIGRANV